MCRGHPAQTHACAHSATHQLGARGSHPYHIGLCKSRFSKLPVPSLPLGQNTARPRARVRVNWDRAEHSAWCPAPTLPPRAAPRPLPSPALSWTCSNASRTDFPGVGSGAKERGAHTLLLNSSWPSLFVVPTLVLWARQGRVCLTVGKDAEAQRGHLACRRGLSPDLIPNSICVSHMS